MLRRTHMINRRNFSVGAGSLLTAALAPPLARAQDAYPSQDIHVINAFTIAATLNKQAFMIVVDAKAPYKTIAELTAAMKKKGADASYATAATSGIVLGEMYKAKAGLETVEVRYKDAVGSLNDMQ